MENKQTVMIIDDEIAILRLIGRMIAAAGYDTIQTQDGHEALDILENLPTIPNLITLDLMMPNITGIEVLRKIKSNPTLANIPVIILTAVGQQELLTEAETLGANAYLTKPFASSDLLNTIKDLIAKNSV